MTCSENRNCTNIFRCTSLAQATSTANTVVGCGAAGGSPIYITELRVLNSARYASVVRSPSIRAFFWRRLGSVGDWAPWVFLLRIFCCENLVY